MKKTILANGLRVLTQKIEGTKSVTVLILAKAGSRCETPDIRGLSHFLEHMFFKGGVKYPNTKAVSEAIDSVGGMFNAFTGKEYVGYYVKVASDHKDLAMDVLADMLLTAKLDQVEINKERGVILEEFNMYQDTPMYQVGWDFEKLLFGDQPMGWDQIGLKEVIDRLSHDDFVAYKEKLYRPDNLVITVAGNIDNDEMVNAISKKFDMGLATTDFEWAPILENKNEDRVILQKKKTEQGHVVVGVKGFPESHEDNMSMKLLAIILGGNMSSRMFLNVREAQGLAYYIQTNTDDYTDAGVLSTRAGVDLNRVDLAVAAICEQYALVRDKGVSEEELKKAKDYLKGRMVLSFEDSEEYAHLLGKYEVLYGGARTPEEIIEKIEDVTIKDLTRIATELFQKDFYLAGIGPWEDKERFLKLLHV